LSRIHRARGCSGKTGVCISRKTWRHAGLARAVYGVWDGNVHDNHGKDIFETERDVDVS
jgi:hypothetical protein